jgi:hypothetical protein
MSAGLPVKPDSVPVFPVMAICLGLSLPAAILIAGGLCWGSRSDLVM